MNCWIYLFIVRKMLLAEERRTSLYLSPSSYSQHDNSRHHIQKWISSWRHITFVNALQWLPRSQEVNAGPPRFFQICFLVCVPSLLICPLPWFSAHQPPWPMWYPLNTEVTLLLQAFVFISLPVLTGLLPHPSLVTLLHCNTPIILKLFPYIIFFP